MSCYAGPHEVTSGLVGYWDAANSKSYLNRGTQVIFLTAGTSWTVPADWNNSNNTIEAIGAGGGGGKGDGNGLGSGGGGGEYRKIANVTLTPSGTMAYTIGTAGTAGTSGSGGNGGNTTVMSTTLIAVGGSGGIYSGTVVSTGAAGGTGGTGGTGNAGGAGGTRSTGSGGSGGGGAGGLNGVGNQGSAVSGSSGSNGGSGDAGFGGTAGAGAGLSTRGGTGGAGAEYTATNTWNGTAYTNTTPTGGSGGGGGGGGLSGGGGTGGTYGGGGGGAATSGGTGGPGGAGLIIITYVPVPLYWYDISGNSQTGALTNVTVSSNTMVFDGTNSYITCPNQSCITYAGTYTFSVWVNSVNGGVIFQNSGSSGAVTTDRNGMMISGTSVIFGYYAGGSWQGVSGTISSNQWYYIVGVNSSTSLTVYVNAVPSTTPNSGLYVHSISGLYIGRQTIDATNRFNGSLSNIQVYNRALTAEEVLQNFNALRGRFGI